MLTDASEERRGDGALCVICSVESTLFGIRQNFTQINYMHILCCCWADRAAGAEVSPRGLLVLVYCGGASHLVTATASTSARRRRR